MRVVFTYNITHNSGRFNIWSVEKNAKFPHGIKSPTMNWFQTVSNIWKSPANDDTHGVIKVGFFQFVFDGYVKSHF